MSTQQSAPSQTGIAHRCECGETFESTEALLAHVRDVHRFSPL
ncbi:MAG: hypothetical protein ACLFR6_06960 [Salinarchaeum sp.]